MRPKIRKRVARSVAVTLICVAVLLPLLPLPLWSISGGWWFPHLIPQEFSARAWNYVFSPFSGTFGALFNSTVIALIVTVLATMIGMPAGRCLALGDARKLQPLGELLILLPLLVPALAVAMGVHIFFIQIGLADTVTGVVLVHLLPTLPYMIMVTMSVFSNYDINLEQQAASLGANRLQIMLHVTLPATMPGIVTGALFVFLISWSQYNLTLFIGGGRVITLPLLLFSFVTSGDNALAAAICLIFIAPAILALVFTSRYLTGRSPALSGIGRL